MLFSSRVMVRPMVRMRFSVSVSGWLVFTHTFISSISIYSAFSHIWVLILTHAGAIWTPFREIFITFCCHCFCGKINLFLSNPTISESMFVVKKIASDGFMGRRRGYIPPQKGRFFSNLLVNLWQCHKSHNPHAPTPIFKIPGSSTGSGVRDRRSPSRRNVRCNLTWKSGSWRSGVSLPSVCVCVKSGAAFLTDSRVTTKSGRPIRLRPCPPNSIRRQCQSNPIQRTVPDIYTFYRPPWPLTRRARSQQHQAGIIRRCRPVMRAIISSLMHRVF